MPQLRNLVTVIVSLYVASRGGDAAPVQSTDIFVSQCGFIESTIVVPAPPPPSPPPSPPLLSPPPHAAPSPTECRRTANQNCGSMVPSFTYEPGVLYSGGTIKSNVLGSSASACAWTCLDLSGCTAFSHNITDGRCYFKNSTAVHTPTSGFDSWELCSASSSAFYSARKGLESEGNTSKRRLFQSKNTAKAQPWSDPATWPGGVVPGVGTAVGVNATIPCDTTVVLDLPNVTLSLLRVQGLLMFLDDPSLPLVYVKSNYVLVEGQLFIGSPSQPFQQKAVIELTPNTAGNRSPLQYSFSAPADSSNPRDLGHKAFVVVGGQVQMYGLPGPSDMPVWVRLSKDANEDDTTIQVDADVYGSWPIGGQIVVTSTDYNRLQTETFRIRNVTSTGTGYSILRLDQPLVNRHFGSMGGAEDGYGNSVDQRAEVMLLSRNIVITGTEEPAPYQAEGGHFMLYMTPDPPQYIEGVEFVGMGQEGKPGRYPLNFHILGSVPGTVCRKNSIHQSKQRCIVNRASHNITFESNVAYNTSGHCFVLEEGGEENNTWVNNVGVLTYPASVRISASETDDRPSTFWITNLRNSYVGNVAAGSRENGFWFELRSTVRGSSATIPSINKTVPIAGSITLFANNTAHSNGGVGLRTSPNGMRPRVSASEYGATNVMSGIRSYKNVGIGMFVQYTDSLLITNSVFADNGWGLQFARNSRINVTDSKFISLTSNLGNPSSCWDSYSGVNCRPISLKNCRMPLKWGVPGRSTGDRSRMAPTFGLVVDQSGFWDFWPYTLKNLTFTNFDSTCARLSALVLTGTGDYWNPSYNIEGLSFSNNSQSIWSPPKISQINAWGLSDGGEQAQFYAVFDRDGSLTGSKGYLVANNTAILPPGQAGCTAKPSWNAFACADTCYRSLLVSYPEPGFSSNMGNVNNNRGKFSFLRVTRVSDGEQLLLDGNLRDTNPNSGLRHYFFTLLANQTYQVEVVAPAARPTFTPSTVVVSVRDVGDCGAGLTLQFKHGSDGSWRVTPTHSVYVKLCPGVPQFPPQFPSAQYSEVCVEDEPWLDIVISPGMGNLPISPSINPTYITLVRQNTSILDGGNCKESSFSCSFLWSGTDWLYDDSGLERRPAFYNPVLSKSAVWKSGKSPFGFTTWSTYVATLLRAPSATSLVTYYYRKTFSVKNVNCYSSLSIEVFVHDGVVIYINNVEALRSNLLPGFVNNKTNALFIKNWLTLEKYTIPLTSDTTNFPLNEGSNTIAVEQHMASRSTSFAFDIRIQAIRSDAACNSTQVSKPEICDGLDNDFDGLVDAHPNGSLLTIPCTTSCGVGIMTCIDGYFQACSASDGRDEVCDGLDNNCDGLIDNGKNQLNCMAGNVCFNGACVPVLNATTPDQVWPRNATDWAFHDKGKDLDSLIPNWRTGEASDTCSCSSNASLTNWLRGVAPLGYDYREPAMPWQWLGTEINFFPASGKTFAGYFAKSFTLSSEEVNRTFNIDFSVRRVDGVVVYLNGVELWRDNVNWGNVLISNTSSSYTAELQERFYYPCRNCRRNNSALLRAGVNYIVAELHVAASWRRMATFDMDLFRNVIVACPSSSPGCARQVDQQIFLSGSSWSYLDGSVPVPPSDVWMTTGYNDSSWLTGVAPLGYGSGGIRTWVNNGSTNGSETRRVLYFRRWQNIPEGACYVALKSSLFGKDGAAVYINGVEAYRNFLPNGPLNASVTATATSGNWLTNSNLTGGWLKAGLNLFSVEVHRTSNNASNVYFDLSLSGTRDGVRCSPDPSVVTIPWANG